MRLGILGTSEIAFRRFLPALSKCPDITYAGVASRTPEKGKAFQETYGGCVYASYDALLADDTIDAVYVPLPPALHFEWGKKVLESGKHLLMEKPFTTRVQDTEALLKLAEEKGLTVHENYMFLYHGQLAKIKSLIADGTLGKIRLYRMSFGFPMRGQNDFRYKKELGGGALLDCGGYPVRLALELLGDKLQVVYSKLVQPEGFEVDLYGSAVMENEVGEVAQISFGMDNAYQCQLEIWGSKATLIAPRIFTAGDGVKPTLIIRTSFDESKLELDADDQFLHSIESFAHRKLNQCSYMISRQADLQDQIK
ncbi:Gfo/Idh/MocA family protein [Pseudoflavonifractor phocaeensis]|uniref:Gfo/Idh/MocA family protein n=1 Tax=Pseudoflavonifractor phocaeensis TaxID=1870988 RepID=UPI00195CE4F3|nr:Gfo/Idh/MocA family oxidoreductase [Pseudoflavonifractor phocaeensis]MBM6885151.1 Gfo/Idh/MocA family oxidoreductase [Pseudoflavonifractor phocaeensis]